MATAIKDRIIPSMDTLVKYDTPVLITTHPEKVCDESFNR
jgi:dynein light intermediate chain